MSTIRKTISISSKDPKLQEIIKNVPNYEVSHVIRQLMYDGLKYRNLVEQGVVNDINVQILPQKPQKVEKNEENSNNNEENEQKKHKNEENEQKNNKKEQKSFEFNDFDEEFDINNIKLEEIEEKDEDLEDLLLNNSQF